MKNGTTSITRSDANHFSYARQLDGIDIAQIIMWGFSFSGGTAIAAVAADAGIAGLMLLRPFLDGLARLLKATKSSPALVAWILPGAMKDKLGGHTLTALTGQPGEHAAMTFPGEANGFAAAVPPRLTVPSTRAHRGCFSLLRPYDRGGARRGNLELCAGQSFTGMLTRVRRPRRRKAGMGRSAAVRFSSPSGRRSSRSGPS